VLQPTADLGAGGMRSVEDHLPDPAGGSDAPVLQLHHPYAEQILADAEVVGARQTEAWARASSAMSNAAITAARRCLDPPRPVPHLTSKRRDRPATG
jgi:hypothetical protein